MKNISTIIFLIFMTLYASHLQATYASPADSGSGSGCAATPQGTFRNTPEEAYTDWLSTWPRIILANCSGGTTSLTSSTLSGTAINYTYNTGSPCVVGCTGSGSASLISGGTSCPASGTSSGPFNIEYGTSITAAKAAYAIDSAGFCASGCGYIGAVRIRLQSFIKTGITNYRIAYDGSVSTGSSCSSTAGVSQGIGAADSCAFGQTKANVSGITYCYNSDGTKTNSGPATSCGDIFDNVTTSNADTSTTITTTVTDTCTGKKSVSTKNYSAGVTAPIVPASGSGPSGMGTGEGNSFGKIDPDTGQPSGSISDYCSKNPTAAVCKTTNSQDEYCQAHPDSASCSDLGSPSSSENLSTLNLGVSALTPVTVGSAYSCPSDVSISNSQVSGLTFSWAPICSFAQGLYPIIIAMAWLAAGMIIVGAKQG